MTRPVPSEIQPLFSLGKSLENESRPWSALTKRERHTTGMILQDINAMMGRHLHQSFSSKKEPEEHPIAWVHDHALPVATMTTEIRRSYEYIMPSMFHDTLGRCAGFYAVHAQWEMENIPRDLRSQWLSHAWVLRNIQHRDFLFNLCRKEPDFWDVCCGRLWSTDGRSSRRWLPLLEMNHTPGPQLLRLAILQTMLGPRGTSKHPVWRSLREHRATWLTQVEQAVYAYDMLHGPAPLNQKYVDTPRLEAVATMLAMYDIPEVSLPATLEHATMV